MISQDIIKYMLEDQKSSFVNKNLMKLYQNFDVIMRKKDNLLIKDLPYNMNNFKDYLHTIINTEFYHRYIIYKEMIYLFTKEDFHEIFVNKKYIFEPEIDINFIKFTRRLDSMVFYIELINGYYFKVD